MTESYQTPCISARLRQATRKANSIYDDALKPYGINIAQFSLLRAIQRLDQPSLNSLAIETQLDASTLGRNVRVLEKLDLVRSEAGPDKRTRVHSLTVRGKQISHEAREDWKQVQGRLKASLGPDGYETLFRLLDALEPDRTGPDV